MKPTFLTAHQEFVNASAGKLWKLLIDKIRHPENYIPGVKSATILKEEPKMVHRTMLVSSEGNNMTIEELITWSEDTKTVIFKLVNHRYFEGYVINQIFEDGDKVLLDYTLNWHLKIRASLPDLDMETMIKNAVLQTKKMAEGSTIQE